MTTIPLIINSTRYLSRIDLSSQLWRIRRPGAVGRNSSRLFGAGDEDEDQNALHSDRLAVDGRRYEDPFSRRLYGRALQRNVAADGRGVDDKPGFGDDNLHFDCPCGVHLLGTRRIIRVDFCNGSAY